MSEVVNELKKELGYPTRSPPVPGCPPADIRQGQVAGALLGALATYGIVRCYLEPPSTSKATSSAREEVAGKTLPAPPASDTALSQDQRRVSDWKTLHDLLRRERIRFYQSTVEDTDNPGDWTAMIFFSDPFRGNHLGTFVGKGTPKFEAKNVAAKKALAAINQISPSEEEKSESAAAGDGTRGKT
ncbi:hypothetical protein FRC00_001727 [Tulasnella sp. 408]|nr:hypothetical protein FRC00_001727 [Tulasnella sp. 408]